MADYAKKKNDELATLCKERNLPHSGKKAELVKRLEDYDAKQNTEAPAEKPAANEDEIDWDDEPATEAAKTATTEAAATAIAAGGQGPVDNPQDVPNQEAAIDPAQTDDLKVAAGPTDAPAVDTEAEKKRKEEEDAKFRAGIAESTLDEEIAKRKARRARFGITGDDEELKKLERAKRFGASLSPLDVLNKGLPEEREKKQKRGRETSENDSKNRKKSKTRADPAPAPKQGQKQGGGKPKAEKSGYPAWMTEKDKEAAAARKARFATA
ncbi:hypothetical protein Slin15195_G015850 [Septoria linicola]|uniref:SAP domain-containing protein n=1 Tax=Septoria linicola TaxID=215465 RepID=A0A9Q9AP51_9PEZI|nr:hypothetical protein Slin14017_G015910 [Septoria linicola]USW48266.1 hypothetical protein Slin15195_G015850 [Septoria linicola]